MFKSNNNSSYNRRSQQPQQRQQVPESLVKFVQIDGLAILKIIKHCHEDEISSDAQGVLLGLVSKDCLEITNCFPFPKTNDDDEGDEVVEHQYAMMKHLHNVNVDNLQVGWYQCNSHGSQLNKLETVDSQFVYQSSIDESVVLFFDPVRTKRGFLSLKAFRLTNVAMKMCKEGEFTPETSRKSKMSFEKFFEEIPIAIRNSHLAKALLLEIEETLPVDSGRQLLDIGGFSVVEKSMQSLIKSVEELNKQAYSVRNQAIKNHEVARENLIRESQKIPPLNEEEVAKIMKPFKQAPLQRLNNILTYTQTFDHSQQSSLYATQNIGKLFLAKAVQNTNNK